MRNYTSIIDDNARNARSIVTSIMGKGVSYADARKNGVRYKWFIERNVIPTMYAIEAALKKNGIKNWELKSGIGVYDYRKHHITLTMRKI